jgi:benzodiazapine receptor
MSTLSLPTSWEQKLKWYHGVIFYFVMHVLAAPWMQTAAYVDSQIKAPFAPPNWVFAPVWLFNTVLMVWAGFLLLRSPKENPVRQPLIVLQIISWVCFIVFGEFYFGLHSPILGASVTLTMLAVTVPSIVLGFKFDKRFSYAFVPLLIWLIVANGLAIYSLLYNHDDFLNVGPFLFKTN